MFCRVMEALEIVHRCLVDLAIQAMTELKQSQHLSLSSITEYSNIFFILLFTLSKTLSSLSKTNLMIILKKSSLKKKVPSKCLSLYLTKLRNWVIICQERTFLCLYKRIMLKKKITPCFVDLEISLSVKTDF